MLWEIPVAQQEMQSRAKREKVGIKGAFKWQTAVDFRSHKNRRATFCDGRCFSNFAQPTAETKITKDKPQLAIFEGHKNIIRFYVPVEYALVFAFLKCMANINGGQHRGKPHNIVNELDFFPME